MPSTTSRRGLSTARAALQVAWLLVARPQGIRADDVAESSARASRRPTTCSSASATKAWRCTTPAACTGSRRPSRDGHDRHRRAADELHDLSGVVAELLARTHKRSYLGLLRAGELHVVAERGAQGMAKLPGPGRPNRRQRARAGDRQGDARHGPARGRRALPAGRAAALQRPHDHRSRRPARRSARGPPHAASRSTARSSTTTSAASRAPVLDPRGRFLAAIGISMTRRAFDDEHARARGDAPRRHRIPGIFRIPGQFLIARGGGPSFSPATTVP